MSSKLERQDTLQRPEMEDIPVSVWHTTLDGMPLKVTEWVNDKGDVVQMVIDSGAGKIEGRSPSCLIQFFFVEAKM